MNTMTESQASHKICPMHKGGMCIGSKCGAWRWNNAPELIIWKSLSASRVAELTQTEPPARPYFEGSEEEFLKSCGDIEAYLGSHLESEAVIDALTKNGFRLAEKPMVDELSIRARLSRDEDQQADGYCGLAGPVTQ